MWQKFRRNSKEPVASRSSSLAAVESGVDDQLAKSLGGTPSAARLSFFELPAEIRNTIYECVIADTVVTLPSSLLAAGKKSKIPLKRRKAPPTPINGLLLASRQCRREYLSMLFSVGCIVVEVKDFDFDGLIRASSSLGEPELQALQSNRNLTVLLATQNCRTKDAIALRKWLDHRRDSQINLAWKYEFPLDTLLPPTDMGRVRLLRELGYYVDTISMLLVDVDEPQRRELEAIIDAFRSKVDWLEEDLGELGRRARNFTSTLRGLPGGGVTYL